MSFDLVYAIILLASFATTPVLALYLFVLWKKRGKDPKGRTTIIPQYNSFEHIQPAVMAVVLKEQIHVQDMLATLIDLAQRGYVQVEYVRATFGQTFTEKNVTTNFVYILKQLKPADGELKKFESLLFKSIFTSGPTTYILNFLEEELRRVKADFDAAVYAEAMHLGLIHESPEEIRQKYERYSKRLKIVGWVLFITVIGVPLLANAYMIRWFGKVMPVRTRKGVAALEWSRGLELYIQHAERFRLNRPSGELQQLLPEAMVLNVVDQWSAHVKSDTAQVPSWYQTPVASADAVVKFVYFLTGF